MDEGSVDGRRNQLISHVVPKSRSCGVLSFMTTAGPPKDGGAREGKTCTKIRAGRATTSRRPLRGAETQPALWSVAACVHLLCHSPCLIYNNGRGSSNLPHPSRRHPSASTPRGGLPLPAWPPSLPPFLLFLRSREHNERGHHFKPPQLSEGPLHHGLRPVAAQACWPTTRPTYLLANVRASVRSLHFGLRLLRRVARVSALPSKYGLLVARPPPLPQRRRRRRCTRPPKNGSDP